ncbi:hypothetical protein [Sphingomonas humi]|uniref:Lipoprotein n=1 Tax=Sphingomonas humi TaxID=335630 RepID=A0ABP7RW26_9SPHN
MTIVRRAAPAAALLALLAAGCARDGTLTDTGVYVTRTGCPQVAIPAATGDITLFDPANSREARAIDVVATITNIRVTCSEDAANVVSTATFDVLATRRDAGPARQVVLPYFAVAVQGGTNITAKKVGAVALDFPAGQIRAQTSSQTTTRINRASVALPADIQRELTRERKPGDPDAAVDPLSDPKVREAVARATYEQLIGFQLTPDQLRYNATR